MPTRETVDMGSIPTPAQKSGVAGLIPIQVQKAGDVGLIPMYNNDYINLTHLFVY